VLATYTNAGVTTTTEIAVVTPAPTYLPSADHVDMAADAVRAVLGDWKARNHTLRGQGLPMGKYHVRHGERFTLQISGGVVALRRQEMKPYESHDVPWHDTSELTLFDIKEDDDFYEEPTPSRAITEWSRPSRARFHRRMAELDYSPWEDKRLGMVTLTLPDHWQRIAPTGARFKELLDAYRKAWERATGAPLLAVWKLEFQGRGAPHLHMLCEIPKLMGGLPGPEWIGSAWVKICDPQGKDRARMWAAHLPNAKRPSGVVDFSHRATDPKRIAVYFGKHSAKTRDSKSYQHVVPREWQQRGAGPGRFWGYWTLQRAVVEVEIARHDFYRARRILRHVARSRAALHLLGLRRAAQVVSEPLRRATLESLRVPDTRLLRGQGGGWVLTNDGLLTAYDLARALANPA